MQSTAGKETSDPSVLQPPGPVHYAPLLRPSCGSLEDICVACLGSTLEKRKRHDSVCHCGRELGMAQQAERAVLSPCEGQRRSSCLNTMRLHGSQSRAAPAKEVFRTSTAATWI